MVDSIPPYSALFRLSETSFNRPLEFTATQAQADAATSHFLEESSRFSTLAQITAGAGAFRLGRTGLMALGANTTGWVATGIRGLSYGGGLLMEVVAFEGTGRGIFTLQGDHSNPDLWRWSGRHGWRNGMGSGLITFGALKFVGHATQGQNIVLQHTLQSLSLVAGHNMASAFHLMPEQEGTLAEQFFHAELTNIQLGVGTSALHMMAPGLHAWERSSDLSLRSKERDIRRRGGVLFPFQEPSRAFAENNGSVLDRSESSERPEGPFILLMAKGKGRGRGRSEENDRDTSDHFPGFTPLLENFLRRVDRNQLKDLSRVRTIEGLFRYIAENKVSQGLDFLEEFIQQHSSSSFMTGAVQALEGFKQSSSKHRVGLVLLGVLTNPLLSLEARVRAAEALLYFPFIDPLLENGVIDLENEPAIRRNSALLKRIRKVFTNVTLNRLALAYRSGELARGAKDDPVKVLELCKSASEDVGAQMAVREIPVRNLARMAKKDLTAVFALYNLAKLGNESAKAALITLDPQAHIHEAKKSGSTEVLRWLAEMGNEGAAHALREIMRH